jgi:hypothetical protein
MFRSRPERRAGAGALERDLPGTSTSQAEPAVIATVLIHLPTVVVLFLLLE